MKTMRISSWNEQVAFISGGWRPMYVRVYTVREWIKTPEQKRQEKLLEEQNQIQIEE